ncbi:hypothetical protein C9374_004486 [Naegleria lovaniensis]|uniref:Uncharacterized protein n=1 Tax=Naegleria lovaniensis TaxID=51637 RepID=A0AA88KIS5_NAELO|nr:uncharacterized protein C9374_004486 [Naegleria lovaniensis]KAG2383149.1 hypothetical protein C9374_004486 [Naegleria lovaniensis]
MKAGQASSSPQTKQGHNDTSQQANKQARSITKYYDPKSSLSHIIGDYRLLSPWNKLKFNIIQFIAEWRVLSHNISQQQTMHHKYKYSDPYLEKATREMYHPQIVSSMKQRFSRWFKYSLYLTAFSLLVVYPSACKIWETEKKRRELYLSQKYTFDKEKSI